MEYMKEKRTRKRTKMSERKKKLGLREGVRGRERERKIRSNGEFG